MIDPQQQNASIKAAHDRLVTLAASINWATDGTLTSAVRHIEEYVRQLNEQIEDKQAVIDAVTDLSPTWPRGMYGSPDDMYSGISLRRALETKPERVAAPESKEVLHVES